MATRIKTNFKRASLNQLTMAMGLAYLHRSEPVKCKQMGDTEQLMQDFIQYRDKMELIFTTAQVVGAHTGDPAGRSYEAHTVCNSCKQEKAMVVMLGGEEMKKLFEHVGGVTPADSYIKAMDKVEQGIKRLTNQATARFKLFQKMHHDGRGFSWWMSRPTDATGPTTTSLWQPVTPYCSRWRTRSFAGKSLQRTQR